MHLTDMKLILFAILGLFLINCGTPRNVVEDLPYYCSDQNKAEMRQSPPHFVNIYEFSDTNSIKLSMYLDSVTYLGDTIEFSKVLQKIKYPEFCAELIGRGSTGYFYTFLLDDNDQITNVELVRKGGCDEEMTALLQNILEKTQFIAPTFDAKKIVMRLVVKNQNH